MAGGSADGVNCYCHNLSIFGAGDLVNMDIRLEWYRSGESYERHLENPRGTLDHEVYGKQNLIITEIL